VCVGMPIQKKSGSEMSPKHVQGAGPGVKKNTATPPLPAPPSPAAGGPRSAPTGGRRVIPPRQELIFHCQLAHGSPTKEIKDFTNVKELYARIAAAFGISPDQIIFCTLNSHKIDMTKLLGGQIGLEDFIFAHVKGTEKEITINKTEPALGLTITDNGAGYSFVKRIREGSVVAQDGAARVGDLIVSINGRSMVGLRHFDVAKTLKELPLYQEFSLRLVEPQRTFEGIAPRGSGMTKPTTASILDGDPGRLEQAVEKEGGRATLRLKKDGQATVEEVRSWEVKAARKADDLLESYVGIRDMELGLLLPRFSQKPNKKF
jgi:hypothetical protein